MALENKTGYDYPAGTPTDAWHVKQLDALAEDLNSREGFDINYPEDGTKLSKIKVLTSDAAVAQMKQVPTQGVQEEAHGTDLDNDAPEVSEEVAADSDNTQEEVNFSQVGDQYVSGQWTATLKKTFTGVTVIEVAPQSWVGPAPLTVTEQEWDDVKTVIKKIRLSK